MRSDKDNETFEGKRLASDSENEKSMPMIQDGNYTIDWYIINIRLKEMID